MNQLEILNAWANGELKGEKWYLHDFLGKEECLPDFSCCYPELDKMRREEKLEYKRKYIVKRIEREFNKKNKVK